MEQLKLDSLIEDSVFHNIDIYFKNKFQIQLDDKVDENLIGIFHMKTFLGEQLGFDFWNYKCSFVTYRDLVDGAKGKYLDKKTENILSCLRSCAYEWQEYD